MNSNIIFFIFESLLLGVGLAVDAFSVSVVNGIANPNMKRRKTVFMASLFGFFQALMPFIGWICIKIVLSFFNGINKYVPWIAFALLLYIGIKMIVSSFKVEEGSSEFSLYTLIVQAIATSIDALSAGLKFANYDLWQTLAASLIIAAVTFVICLLGTVVGKKFGAIFSSKAQIIGGIILIAIGVEILLSGLGIINI